MIIYDFSPCFQSDDRQEMPDRVALYADKIGSFYRAYNYLAAYYGADFPNGLDITYQKAKSFYRKNAKIYISCCWNSITGRYELTITNKSIIKANWKFWKYDFIGTLSDFAVKFKPYREAA